MPNYSHLPPEELRKIRVKSSAELYEQYKGQIEEYHKSLRKTKSLAPKESTITWGECVLEFPK